MHFIVVKKKEFCTNKALVERKRHLALHPTANVKEMIFQKSIFYKYYSILKVETMVIAETFILWYNSGCMFFTTKGIPRAIKWPLTLVIIMSTKSH